MCIEATPSGQGPVVHAHLPRSCVARGSSSSGVGALGRGPLEFISPCCAIHSLHDCLLGESGVHVGQCQPFCNWVSPSAPCVSEPGPPKRPPTRRLLLPRTGLAHGTFDVTSYFRFGQECCCESLRSPPQLRRSVLALHPSWSLPHPRSLPPLHPRPHLQLFSLRSPSVPSAPPASSRCVVRSSLWSGSKSTWQATDRDSLIPQLNFGDQ